MNERVPTFWNGETTWVTEENMGIRSDRDKMSSKRTRAMGMSDDSIGNCKAYQEDQQSGERIKGRLEKREED